MEWVDCTSTGLCLKPIKRTCESVVGYVLDGSVRSELSFDHLNMALFTEETVRNERRKYENGEGPCSAGLNKSNMQAAFGFHNHKASLEQQGETSALTRLVKTLSDLRSRSFIYFPLTFFICTKAEKVNFVSSIKATTLF